MKTKTTTVEEPKDAPGKNRAMGAKFMGNKGASSRQVMTNQKINDFTPFSGNSSRNVVTKKLSVAGKSKSVVK